MEERIRLAWLSVSGCFVCGFVVELNLFFINYLSSMLIGMAFEHSLAYTIVTTALVRSGDYILFSVDHNDAFVLAFSVNE